MPPVLERVRVKDLTLDLANFRTVAQSSELASIEAMLAISADRFWALTESLLTSGYLPTDNIIVLKSGTDGTLVVKEGNRRVGAMKLIHKLIPADDLVVPTNIADLMGTVTQEWLDENHTLPCSVFDSSEADIVDRIVTLAHGKGEKAGRDPWNAVARARHNRKQGEAEPALDLLESYLVSGRNINEKQRATWAGDYPYSVLDEAIKKLAPRLEVANSAALAEKYPHVRYRDALESTLYGIGQKTIGFAEVRREDFALADGIPPLQAQRKDDGGSKGGNRKGKKTKGGERKPRAYPVTDPRSVAQKLKGLGARGKDRDKVATLLEEGSKLDLEATPLAFCFVLRSIFEISALAYCKEHRIPRIQETGKDKRLKDLLLDVIKHLVASHSDNDFERALHGARTQLARSTGLLSVTSMNALVHNPDFHVAPRDVATLFHQVFPLVKAMNGQ